MQNVSHEGFSLHSWPHAAHHPSARGLEHVSATTADNSLKRDFPSWETPLDHWVPSVMAREPCMLTRLLAPRSLWSWNSLCLSSLQTSIAHDQCGCEAWVEGHGRLLLSVVAEHLEEDQMVDLRNERESLRDWLHPSYVRNIGIWHDVLCLGPSIPPSFWKTVCGIAGIVLPMLSQMPACDHLSRGTCSQSSVLSFQIAHFIRQNLVKQA